MVMFKPISLYIGLKYTRARRSNHFISFIALVSMIGLTLGVAVLITVLSVMNGFDRVEKSCLGNDTSSDCFLDANFNKLAWTCKADWAAWTCPGVAPLLNYKVCWPHRVRSLASWSADWTRVWEKVSIIQNHMVEGSIDSLKKVNSVLFWASKWPMPWV